MNAHSRICVSIGRTTIDDVLAAADSVAGIADVLEIRLDCLAAPAVSPFMTVLNLPILFTNRPVWEGGNFAGEEEQRIAALLEAVREGCAYVDLELLSPEDSHRQLLAGLEQSQTKLILSWHNFENTPSRQELVGRLAMMQDRGADIGKIITTAHSHEDVLRVLQLQESAAELGISLIAFCMGREGVVSRVATTDLGGYMTYCAVSPEEATAPGQLTAERLRDIYSLMNG